MLCKLRLALHALHLTRGLGIDELLDQLRQKDVRQRLAAAEALGPFSCEPRVREALLEALSDAEPFVRWQAAASLTRARSSAILPLLETALNSKSIRRRCMAADALGWLGDKRAGASLTKALHSKNAELRCSAAEAMGRLADPENAPALIAACRDDDPIVRRAVAQALGASKSLAAFAPLVELLHDEYALVRAAAATGLAVLGQAQASLPLEDALCDGDPTVRRAAMRALSQVGDARALVAIEPLLSDTTQVLDSSLADVARETIEAISRRNKPQHVVMHEERAT